MSVLLETTHGDIVIDVHYEQYAIEAYNFLKLCKSNFYQYQCFYNLQKGRSIELGNALYRLENRKELRFRNTSIEGILSTSHGGAKLIKPSQKHSEKKCQSRGSVGMIVDTSSPNDLIGSQIIITLSESDTSGTNTIFFASIPSEYWKTLDTIDSVVTDHLNMTTVDIRVRKAHIIYDPFPDPEGLVVYTIPIPLNNIHIPTEQLESPEADTEEHKILKQEIRKKELTLEAIGDIPFAGIKPSEKVLFICKLNSITKAKDLATIFQRFGEIISVEIVHDKETGMSLGYGFIEFQDQQSCEEAYKKMEGVIIDDKKVHVDFSQSINKRNLQLK